MIVAMLLFGYAAAVSAAPRLLRRGWVSRSPGLAIALWQLVLATVVLATLLGLLALAVPAAAKDGLAAVLHACVAALGAGYRSPAGDRLVFLLGIGLATGVIVRIGACLAAELWRAARYRRRHVHKLALLGRPDTRLGVTVLDHPRPAAYCVPGRRRHIVLTTATLAALNDDQLAAVLAHERAHLDGRHDLVIASARALARAFPLPVFTNAAVELTMLVEMVADDAVRTPEQRRTLATALLSVASGGSPEPVAVLAAATTDVLARVRRLTQRRQPLPAVVTAAVAVAGVLAALLPVVIAVAPAAVAATVPYCPIPS